MKYLILAVLLVSGCGRDEYTGINDESKINDVTTIITVNVKGKDLLCVKFNGSWQSGVSCNWDKYNKENNQ